MHFLVCLLLRHTFLLKGKHLSMREKEMRKGRLDLRGKTFGSLRAIAPGPNKNGKTTWICHCEVCGNEKIVKTKDLTTGRATSCGCQWKKRGVELLHYVDGTCIEALQNTKVRSNNKTGHTGVYYDSVRKNYRVEIMLQGKRHYLGRYKTLEEAVAVREKARMDYHQAFINKHTHDSDK